ncbi:hypothetical protein EV359DRAFT_85921 [Lentinula novae-zelandiae]|nr:hypothetical protein EV359DRAFT_85921 [Lentinula novae-zelandiae]
MSTLEPSPREPTLPGIYPLRSLDTPDPLPIRPIRSCVDVLIGYAALVQVATDEGFDGEYDVYDRLEHGENNAYAKPLISYVSHCIGTERSQLKDHFSVVLGAFNLSHASGTAPAINLVQRRTYFYPQTPNILDERYTYDYSQPFEHPVFTGYMGAAFFSSTYYSGIIKRYSDVFVSSIQEKPNELEDPKALVALASMAIHACIQDFSSGIKDNFPTKELVSCPDLPPIAPTDSGGPPSLSLNSPWNCFTHPRTSRVLHKPPRLNPASTIHPEFP